jgi:hypothetical protein
VKTNTSLADISLQGSHRFSTSLRPTGTTDRPTYLLENLFPVERGDADSSLNAVKVILDQAVHLEGLELSACYDVWRVVSNFSSFLDLPSNDVPLAGSHFAVQLSDEYSLFNPLMTSNDPSMGFVPVAGGAVRGMSIVPSRIGGFDKTRPVGEGFRTAAASLYDAFRSVADVPGMLREQEARADWDFFIEGLGPTETRTAKAQFVPISRQVPEFLDDRDE